MDYKYCCVVDADGAYKTFVLVLLEQDEERVQYYTLQDGEQMVDANPPAMRPYAGATGFVSPRWDDETEAWTEGASAEEIAAWEAEHPAPEVPEPSGGDAAQAVQEVWDEMAAAIKEGVNDID